MSAPGSSAQDNVLDLTSMYGAGNVRVTITSIQRFPL